MKTAGFYPPKCSRITPGISAYIPAVFSALRPWSKPRSSSAAAPGEDFDEAEEYGEDYGGGEYDDLPPWDEDGEETEGGE